MSPDFTSRCKVVAMKRFSLALVVLLAGGCGLAKDDTPPVLKNLVVAFGPYNAGTGRAGDFLFEANEDKVFLEFNAEVTGPDGPKLLPTFEYRVAADASVYSPVNGTITRYEFQNDTQDYEIGISSAKNALYSVNIDHITNIAVEKGDVVGPGDLLGNPGPWSATLGRTELMIVDDDRAYCPFSYFDESLRGQFEEQVSDLMSDWETFKGDDTIYDEAQMVYPGCNDLEGIP